MIDVLEITVLGCGPSSGVPLAGYASPFWGNCNPSQVRNQRTRSSVYIRYKQEGILIDAGPDLRHHLLVHGLMDLKEIILTHDHADHVQGLDEMRPVFFARGKTPYTLKADEDTLKSIKNHFSYLFSDEKSTIYPKIFKGKRLASTWQWQGLECCSFLQDHGYSFSRGIRVGSVAYSTDFIHLNQQALECLQNLDVWIVDCLSLTPKPTHCHLEKTLMWIEKVKPKKVFLTHMGHELDYDTLCRSLPDTIRPAYDGLVLNVPLLF